MFIHRCLISCALYLLIPIVAFGLPDSSSDLKKHHEVSMRMIGHQLLLNWNDSTSRVLPIENNENRYTIRFENDFSFVPEVLVRTINKVMLNTQIATHYIVEVEACNTKSIVYSYEVNESTNLDDIPCLSRALPEDCYNVHINLLSPVVEAKSNVLIKSTKSQSDFWVWISICVGLFIVLFLYYVVKKRNSNIQSNLIQIGGYQFDKRNMELIFDQQRIELTSKEADLLDLLLSSANDTVTREEILQIVWGDEGDYVGRTLDVFISKLRKKLEEDSTIKIANIRGVGYKLILN